MKPHTGYCCAKAKSTKHLRYGKTITRVTHETHYYEGLGTCTATGTTSSPDPSICPAKSTVRRFGVGTDNDLWKWYLCKEHRNPPFAQAKTVAAAIALHITERLAPSTAVEQHN